MIKKSLIVALILSNFKSFANHENCHIDFNFSQPERVLDFLKASREKDDNLFRLMVGEKNEEEVMNDYLKSIDVERRAIAQEFDFNFSPYQGRTNALFKAMINKGVSERSPEKAKDLIARMEQYFAEKHTIENLEDLYASKTQTIQNNIVSIALLGHHQNEKRHSRRQDKPECSDSLKMMQDYGIATVFDKDYSIAKKAEMMKQKSRLVLCGHSGEDEITFCGKDHAPDSFVISVNPKNRPNYLVKEFECEGFEGQFDEMVIEEKSTYGLVFFMKNLKLLKPGGSVLIDIEMWTNYTYCSDSIALIQEIENHKVVIKPLDYQEIKQKFEEHK